MSVMANNFKMKFAGLLRGLLRRVDGNEEMEPQTMRSAVIASAPPTPSFVTSSPAPVAAAPSERAIMSTSPASTPTRPDNMSDLEMPLLPILEKLPPDIRSKWMIGGMNLEQANICISVEKVLPQLALGAVKITFGELRHAAPALFRMGEEYDSLPIVLPLNDVLARLNPALLARATAQKAISAPSDVAGPFGTGAQGVAFTNSPVKQPTPPTTHFYRKTPPKSDPIKMPAQTPLAPPPPSMVQRAASPMAPAPMPIPMTPRPVRPFQMPQAPAAPLSMTPAPVQARPPAPLSKPVAPTAVPVTSAVPTMLTSLAALSENWPATLRLEITQLNLSGAQVALPVHLIEPALKRGRVTFPWHNLRSWIRPTPPGISIHDGMELELPLKVLAPLFVLPQKKEVKPQVMTSLPPSSVPNLFFGFPQPQPEELAPPLNAPDVVPVVKPVEAKLAETNYYVWGDNADAPRTDEVDYKRPLSPATDFSNRRATPKEIVEKAMKLPGVVGSIVALPDGLKVAHFLPSDLNPDTVAAFLPQLFSRVSQCSKELRMGELNNLNFTTGTIPWKIFRVNAVYFAAIGRAGAPLPTAQLAELAGELDRKK